MLEADTKLDFRILDRRTVDPLTVSVVVPTLNERDNVLRLFDKLAAALAGLEWEAIFVDDGSTDGTIEAVTRLARTDRRARLVSRIGRRGLSSAVIEGMMSSTAPVVAVIDADLQHDERVLPQLVAAVDAGEFDLAVGSRYALGGSLGEWAGSRERISRVATRLAEVVAKAPLADPMSGFFAIRRDKVLAAAPHLSGKGFKILLDLIASSPTRLRITELPYRFRARDAGDSKLDTLVVAEYLLLLAEKLIGPWLPVRLLMFLAVGGTGVVVHLAALGLLMRALALPFSLAMPLATMTAMTSNFFLNNVFTYRDRRLHGWRMIVGLAKFCLVCSAGAVANVAIAEMVVRSQPWWLAGAAGAIASAVWNFAMSGIFAWSDRRA